MKANLIKILLVIFLGATCFNGQAAEVWWPGNHPDLRFTGRVQSLEGITRFWNPGVYMQCVFKADTLKLVIRDQQQYGVQHNYITLQIDEGLPRRMRLNKELDTLCLAVEAGKEHQLTLCKDTESSIGYLDLVAIAVSELLPGPATRSKLIEFFGDSITCGASADTSLVACGANRWEDQHNAFQAFGPRTARALGADWVLTAVSGIGLVHSCCNLPFNLPQVYDKLVLCKDSIDWPAKAYQPDLAVICLGQNDGIRSEADFVQAYLDFVRKIHGRYPRANILLLNSPMAGKALKAYLSRVMYQVQRQARAAGIDGIYQYSFQQTHNEACDGHPSVAGHHQIARELVDWINRQQLLSG